MKIVSIMEHHAHLTTEELVQMDPRDAFRGGRLRSRLVVFIELGKLSSGSRSRLPLHLDALISSITPSLTPPGAGEAVEACCNGRYL